jgi:hypothetical protein
MQRFLVASVVLVSFLLLHAEQSTTKKTLSPGTTTNNIYRNPDLGFTYKIIYGWVTRTEQMRDASTDPSNAQVLLAVFERPPEVKGEDVNPAVIIAAESLASYPDVKTASDYLDTLTQAATSRGFKAGNDPYETTVGGKALVGRDFSKQEGKVTMYQSSLVMLSKGYALSFTFIGGSEDEVEQLIGGLNFQPSTPRAHFGGSDKTKSKPH